MPQASGRYGPNNVEAQRIANHSEHPMRFAPIDVHHHRVVCSLGGIRAPCMRTVCGQSLPRQLSIHPVRQPSALPKYH